MTIDEVRDAIKNGETIQQQRFAEDGWLPAYVTDYATGIMPGDVLIEVRKICPDGAVGRKVIRTLDELRKVPDA